MILCDTGPLVALIDRDDRHHKRCAAALDNITEDRLLTTWPCLVEAMYLLGRGIGQPAQDELWSYMEDGLVVLHLPEAREWERLRVLMRKYRDIPMDLADASLVAVAELLGMRRIFTLDRHFHAYRIRDRQAFEVLP